MKKLLMCLAVTAPIALAACEDVGVQREQTVINGSAEEQATIIPGSPTTGDPTVVVEPTSLISTNLAALAGNYDKDQIACNHPESPSRVTIAEKSITMNGQQCSLADIARDGSALKADLSCVAGNSRTERVVYVTPAAQGITLRASADGDQQLLRCDS